MWNTLGIVLLVILLIVILSGVADLIVQIIETRKEDRSRKIRQYISRETLSWELVELEAPNNTIECFEAIVDDATCHGFEFKVDNGKIYFREVE